MLIELGLFGGAAGLCARPRRNALVRSRQRAAARPAGRAVRSGHLSLRALARELKGAVAADGQRGLKLDLDPHEQATIDRERREGTRNRMLSAGAAGLALLGHAWAPLALAGGAAVLWLSRHLFALVLKDFKRGRYFSVYVVSALMLLGMLLTGQILLAAVVGVVGGFFAKILERVEDDSEQTLVRVLSGHPAEVWVLREGVEIAVDFHQVRPGDLVVVNAGEVVPVDGIVRDGMGQADQHLLTGESQPVEKAPGDGVLASTLLISGRLVVSVETAGQDTVAARSGGVLTRTQSDKDTVPTHGRRIADSWLPMTVGLSALTWPLLGPQQAIAVLWANPGGPMAALGPLSVLAYLQNLARYAILIKDGRVLESLRQVDTVVFDKTGTLTLEQPEVARVHSLAWFSEADVLRAAAAAEYRQTHPIARAILAAAESAGLALPRLDDARCEVGDGIRLWIDRTAIRVGSARFIARDGVRIPKSFGMLVRQAQARSHSLVYVVIGERLAGAIELMPSVRPEARPVVAYLKGRGIAVSIVSGDREAPTRRMAEQLGIERWFAETLPESKAGYIERLRAEGRFVCFVGDGIDDAIALKAAQVSISLKGASTAATDTAQIVFMDGTLGPMESLFRYSDELESTMRTNLAASFALGVAIVSGVYLLHLGIAAAMGIFYAGTLAGMGHALYPLVKHREAAGDRLLPAPQEGEGERD